MDQRPPLHPDVSFANRLDIPEEAYIGTWNIAPVVPPSHIKFLADGEEVGDVGIDDGRMEFYGDTEACAQIVITNMVASGDFAVTFDDKAQCTSKRDGSIEIITHDGIEIGNNVNEFFELVAEYLKEREGEKKK